MPFLLGMYCTFDVVILSENGHSIVSVAQVSSLSSIYSPLNGRVLLSDLPTRQRTAQQDFNKEKEDWVWVMSWVWGRGWDGGKW